jgi:hypothetical protein
VTEPLSSPARAIARIGSQHCLLVSPHQHYHPGGRLQSSKKPVVPNHSLDVRYWHKADMLNALTNIRF